MFKKENLRKNFLRVKQNIDQNLGRAEKSEVLSEDQQENEKRVDVVKHAVQNIVKKAGAVLQAPGTDNEKRLRKLPETGLSHALTESAQGLGPETLLGSVCQICGDCQMSLAREHVQYETLVEQEVIVPLQNILDVDIPSIIKFRKALNKSTLDMDSAKTRFNQAVRQSGVPGANMANAAAKADVIREEFEEASQKVENIKDSLSIELCNFAAKESEHSYKLLALLEAQAAYHKKALEAIEDCIPQMRLAIQNSPAKPCYGLPLEEHLRVMCRDIAVVLEACILTLFETGMEEEGLFRIAGAAMKVKKLKASFDANAVDMEEFSTDPHTVAGAMKQYLRELPEPLLTYALYDDFLHAASLPQDQRLQALWTVINRLPKPNYNNFRYLIKFLSKLAEKKDVNKMTPSNIAIVIGPNLMWPENESGPNMLTTGTLSAIIEAVVSHADWFFPGVFDFHVTGHGSSPSPSKEPAGSFTFPSRLEQLGSRSPGVEANDTGVGMKGHASPATGQDEGGSSASKESDDFKKLPVEDTLKIRVSPPVKPGAGSAKNVHGDTEDSSSGSSDENNPFSEKFEVKMQMVSESAEGKESQEKGEGFPSPSLMLGGSQPNGHFMSPHSTNTGDYDNIMYTLNPHTPMYRTGHLSRSSTLGARDVKGSADSLLNYCKQTPAPIPPSRPSRQSKKKSPFSSEQNSPRLGSSSQLHSNWQSPAGSHQQQEQRLQPPPSARYIAGSTPDISLLSQNRTEEESLAGYSGLSWNRPNMMKSDYHSLKRGSAPCILPAPPQFGSYTATGSSHRPLKVSRSQMGPPPTPGETFRVQMKKSPSQGDMQWSQKGQGPASSRLEQRAGPIDKSFHQDAYSTAFALTSLGAGDTSSDYLTRVRAMWDDRHSPQQHSGVAHGQTAPEALKKHEPHSKTELYDDKGETKAKPAKPDTDQSGAGRMQGVSTRHDQRAELDFTNVGYFYEDDTDNHHHDHGDGDHNDTESLTVQITPSSASSQYTSPGMSPVASTNSSSGSLPVPSDSPDATSPIQRRLTRKPAPPPPPERPFTVMVTATTASMTKPSNDSNGAQIGGTCSNSSSSSSNSGHAHHSAPRAAPLASPESPCEQAEPPSPSSMQEREKHRLSSGLAHSERPAMPPPERPRMPPALNAPAGRGHQRSASTGAMMNQSGGVATSGVPNADLDLDGLSSTAL